MEFQSEANDWWTWVLAQFRRATVTKKHKFMPHQIWWTDTKEIWAMSPVAFQHGLTLGWALKHNTHTKWAYTRGGGGEEECTGKDWIIPTLPMWTTGWGASAPCSGSASCLYCKVVKRYANSGWSLGRNAANSHHMITLFGSFNQSCHVSLHGLTFSETTEKKRRNGLHRKLFFTYFWLFIFNSVCLINDDVSPGKFLENSLFSDDHLIRCNASIPLTRKHCVTDKCCLIIELLTMNFIQWTQVSNG